MPPADDQQNVNSFAPQPQDVPQATPPAVEGELKVQQPTVISPTVGQGDGTDSVAAAAPGFSSMPDSPAPVDAPALPADVPPAPQAGDGSVPPVESVPGDVAPAAPTSYQDPGDIPVFPPLPEEDNNNQ